MEKQFDFGKTIRFLKNNPIIKKKIRLLKKNSIIKIKSILKKNQFWNQFFPLWFFFFAFASMEISRKDWQRRVCSRSLRSSIFFLNFKFFVCFNCNYPVVSQHVNHLFLSFHQVSRERIASPHGEKRKKSFISMRSGLKWYEIDA